ncbi:MAG: endonuclease/exonuclease/phosphatase family protein [Planctomycetes bacterium]|nr:endonuclease/exonuclease/phosphatase family protein [Planctomycetota bacterium]
MKAPTLLVVAALTSCAGPQPAATVARATAAPFVVVSSNVRYGTARDGADAWPERRDMLAALLTAQQPTILGVQEALAFQVEFLQQALPHHQRIGVGRDGGSAGEFSALFVDARRFEVLASGTFWLSPTPDVVGSVGWDAALTRICTWARLRDRSDGRSLTVWNTHFDHRGAEARHQAAAMIAARVTGSGEPGLVLGDLNTGESSAPLATLRAAGLRDTFRDACAAATQVGTFHAFRGGLAGDKIDFVLATAGVDTLAATILDQPGPNGHFVSDHHPVTATLRLASGSLDRRQ